MNSKYSYITNYNHYPEKTSYTLINKNKIQTITIKNKYNTSFHPDNHLYYSQLFLTKQLYPNLSYNPFKHQWKDYSTFDNYEYDNTPIQDIISLNQSIDDDYITDDEDNQYSDNDDFSSYSTSDSEDDTWLTM